PPPPTARAFADLLMTPARAEIDAGANRIATDGEIALEVATDPNAIGITAFDASDDAKVVPLAGPCGLVTAPSDFTIRTEEYPLTRRLRAYAVGTEDSPFVGGFLAYLQTGEAQQTMAANGLVGQQVGRGTLEGQGLRLAAAIRQSQSIEDLRLLKEMVDVMTTSDPLSTTFRFQTGSNALDDRARNDLARVARHLAETPGATAWLVGFTDAVGDTELNRELAARRAEQVRDALLGQNLGVLEQVTFQTAGYGGLSPIGCNETAIGRRTNRRVELWVNGE
ncbi:MAG: phosphate ABC transporter substrate-binding/OmpA family protein, partial [Pseudomonadota bacterium]